MVVKGLGNVQLKERNKTDSKIFRYIKSHPGCYVRQIIKETAISPNSVIASLRRLKTQRKIVRQKDSDFFTSNNIPNRAIGYIPNYGSPELEGRAAIQESEKRILGFVKILKNAVKEQAVQRKPIVVKYAEDIAVLLKNNNPHMINEMQQRLGIQYVNESMIGFFIHKIFFDIDIEKDMPYWYSFYYRMLPKKYCMIDIPAPNQLISFMKKNWSDPEDFKELENHNFDCFNLKTRHLLSSHLDRIRN